MLLATVLFLLQGTFLFQPNQAVYIVALESTRADLSQARVSLEVERKAGEEFASRKQFRIARSISGADFVFLALVDAESSKTDELAIVIQSKDYLEHRSDLLELKNLALWFKTGKGGRFSSVVKGLVKSFHSEVLPKKK